MDNRVKKLLEKPQPVQRSKEWFDARKGKITASSVSCLLLRDKTTCEHYVNTYDLTNTFNFDNKCCNPYSNKQQFIMDKIKQVFKGSPATFWGQRFEHIATQIYELKYGCKVIEFGLLSHDTLDWLAASPDGITEEGIMLEIKCPFRRKITGIPPLYYYQQVQIQLEVADLDFCDFLEIEFVEIMNIEEFVDDSLNENEVEYKGLYVQIESIPDELEKREYFYPPKELFNNISELTKWASSETEKIITNNEMTIINSGNGHYKCRKNYKNYTIRTVYWKTVIVNVCRIERDREWFNNIKDFLKNEWDTVLHAKDNYKKEKIIYIEENEEECLF